ncbi:glycosyltransferase [Schaalia meyeri]|uniref:glycosyltransferase family 2 protein n=1 Tax=Schaalia meyeri TaxID=52773 RepID=UPI0006801C59|nr:glycosyltransferase [Schaalia meyeri]AKU65711.1 glycosyltransferase [Schaalia meyeri]
MNYHSGSHGSQSQRVAAVIAAHNIGRAVAATVRACRAIPGVDLLIVVDDGSTDDTGRVARAAGAVVVRHSVERGRASAIETGVKVAAMRDRPDGPPRHILLLSPDLGDSAVEATALVEAVSARQADMTIAVPAQKREYSGYAPGVARRLIRRKTGWTCHYPLSYQRCLTREAINAAMPFNGRYVLEAAMTINVLRAGLSVMEVPCNFTHSGADRSLGSLNRAARMVDALLATVSQGFHSNARSKRRAAHEQGIGVPYPAPASSNDGADHLPSPGVRRTEMVG